MEWNVIAEFIKADLLIVVVACWVIGFTLKQTPKVPDWTIIYGVTLTAIVFVLFLHGFSVDSFLQGLLCGAVAVYGNQIVKQSQKAKGDN